MILMREGLEGSETSISTIFPTPAAAKSRFSVESKTKEYHV
jgi:hypothetical protein